ncbi:hypothetical protein NL676_008439 [Syzygium grande]|nr:hypothetical protein NL676_008439 [Syzygium grande]
MPGVGARRHTSLVGGDGRRSWAAADLGHWRHHRRQRRRLGGDGEEGIARWSSEATRREVQKQLKQRV